MKADPAEIPQADAPAESGGPHSPIRRKHRKHHSWHIHSELRRNIAKITVFVAFVLVLLVVWYRMVTG
ncbi:MAG TPA: hypothetical protein VF135_14210 [Terriglobales bacterium]